MTLVFTPTRSPRSPLTKNQRRGFLAAWGGLTLDGMDSFIYALVLVPALRVLLPRSGTPATPGAIGYYGGLLFAVFLVGWGLSFIWGPIGDRFGRVPTLTLTIACYSLFTFLGAVATNVWMLGAFRLLAGIGIGGEWTLGSTFIAEELPEDRRVLAGGINNSGYYLGLFLAAIVNYTVGTRWGWRAVFAVGGAPILLAGFVRYGVSETKRWTNRVQEIGHAQALSRPLRQLFSADYRVRTWLNMAYLQVSIIGLWAGSVYAPTAVVQLAARAGLSAAEGSRLASWGAMVLAVATIAGCLLAPVLAERMGRRATLAAYFALMFVSILGAFGGAFYLREHALFWFILSLFFLGLGGGSFGLYTFWLPEQYPTECRATAFGFIASIGRFGGAAVTSLVGLGVGHFQSLGIPVALTSLAFLLGLILVPWGVETRGKPLPH
jgi:MFS family permease